MNKPETSERLGKLVVRDEEELISFDEFKKETERVYYERFHSKFPEEELKRRSEKIRGVALQH